MRPRSSFLIAVVGTLVAVSYATAMRLGPRPRERQAATALAALVDAQRAFLSGSGRGRYAASLESLITPCPGAATSTPLRRIAATGYALTVRARAGEPLAAAGSDDRRPHAASRDPGASIRQASEPPGLEASVPIDCHGRPTASDFVASAAPIRPGIDGLRALSVSSDGRIFVFFDGVPPTEIDMAPRGLAMPLDNLRKIP